jgi:hypothetical protein
MYHKWRISIFVFSVAGLAALLAPSCKHTSQQSAAGSGVDFAQGLGGASHGHEKLTELAVKMANQALDPALGNRPTGFRRALPWNWGAGEGKMFYEEDQIHQPAYRNTHPMVWGSLSADFPPVSRGIKITAQVANENRDTSGDDLSFLNFMLCKHYGMAGTSGDPERDLRVVLAQCDKMPTSGAFQDVHFLRRWQGETELETGRAACLGGQARIRAATLQALHSWQSSHEDEDLGIDRSRYPRFMGQYFLGLAMHTIQDAFSGAHIDRDPANPRRIRRICHYNGKVIEKNLHPQVCRHKVPFDPRDLIWRADAVGSLSVTRYVTGAATGILNRIGGEFDDLTPEGQGAVTASAAYLISFARILSELPKAGDGGLIFEGGEADLAIIDQELNHFFNFDGDAGSDARLVGSGYLNCAKVQEAI